MPWILLFIAGLLEIAWAVGLRSSDGFTDVRWSAVTVVGIALSLYLLAVAVRSIPLGTAYAVWTGIGIVGTAVVGLALFGEPRTPARLLFIGMIVAGVIGLRVTAGE